MYVQGCTSIVQCMGGGVGYFTLPYHISEHPAAWAEGDRARQETTRRRSRRQRARLRLSYRWASPATPGTCPCPHPCRHALGEAVGITFTAFLCSSAIGLRQQPLHSACTRPAHEGVACPLHACYGTQLCAMNERVNLLHCFRLAC